MLPSTGVNDSFIEIEQSMNPANIAQDSHSTTPLKQRKTTKSIWPEFMALQLDSSNDLLPTNTSESDYELCIQDTD